MQEAENKTNKTMSQFSQQTLIDYLDNKLEGDELLKTEELLREDSTAAEELKNLLFSVELIREAGVAAEVATARKDFHSGAIVRPLKQEERGAIVRPMFAHRLLHIAVLIIVLLGAVVIHRYAVTNTNSVFDEHFSSFDLNSSRGGNNDGEIELAYRNKDWTAVKNNFKALSLRPPKVWFLAGMAEMETKNYEVAIADFKELIKINETASEKYYQDEAEYYLAMSYIASGNAVAGVDMLRKIRNDKNHLYNRKANEISAMDLKLMEFKSK